MLIIEQLIEGNWELASSHTHPVDRDAQYQRIIASGVPADQLRTVEQE